MHLKVALDATPLTVATGGIRRYVEELVQALSAGWPEDEYCLLSDRLPDVAPPRGWLDRHWWLIGLEREMSRRHIDVFHGTDFTVPYLSRRPSVMTLHDLSPWKGFGGSARVRRRTPWLLRLGRAAAIITPTEAVRREAIAYFGLRPQRVVAIPHAASSTFRPIEGASPAAGPYFLCVGTLEPRKNLGTLLTAWRQIKGARLVLAGRSRPGFALPRQPGLEIREDVSDSELHHLYCGAVATIYVSHYEGFGLPVLESMQCGTPVISSRDPAVVEVAGDAALGVDSVGGLRDAMIALLTQPGRRGRLCEAGLQRAAEFSWRKTAERTRAVYLALALARGSRPA